MTTKNETGCILALALCAAFVAAGCGRRARSISVERSMDIDVAPTAVLVSGKSFALPDKRAFDASVPRLPNLWFFVQSDPRRGYRDIVYSVASALGQALRWKEQHPPLANPEGCDFEASLEHLQPWIDDATLQHAHALHARYYADSIRRMKSHFLWAQLPGDRQKKPYYRFALSVHYEVEHSNANHPHVERCPICGRTGDYAVATGKMGEDVHDPLGLELLLEGTIRRRVVRAEDYEGRVVGGVRRLAHLFEVERYTFPVDLATQHTKAVGLVVLRPR